MACSAPGMDGEPRFAPANFSMSLTVDFNPPAAGYPRDDSSSMRSRAIQRVRERGASAYRASASVRYRSSRSGPAIRVPTSVAKSVPAGR